MQKSDIVWFLIFSTVASLLNAAETDKKVVVTLDMLRQSVTDAHKSDYKRLSDMEQVFRVPDKFVIPKDLLPVYTELLKDREAGVQRLGLTGILYFKDPRSQPVLIDYLKRVNPRQLEDQFNKLSRTEQEKNDRDYSAKMLNAALAIHILGEIADSSVIPFLESLRGIRDLKMEREGNVVDKAVEKIKKRLPANSSDKAPTK
jgi:hypothetical protein